MTYRESHYKYIDTVQNGDSSDVYYYYHYYYYYQETLTRVFRMLWFPAPSLTWSMRTTLLVFPSRTPRQMDKLSWLGMTYKLAAFPSELMGYESRRWCIVREDAWNDLQENKRTEKESEFPSHSQAGKRARTCWQTPQSRSPGRSWDCWLTAFCCVPVSSTVPGWGRGARNSQGPTRQHNLWSVALSNELTLCTDLAQPGPKFTCMPTYSIVEIFHQGNFFFSKPSLLVLPIDECTQE